MNFREYCKARENLDKENTGSTGIHNNNQSNTSISNTNNGENLHQDIQDSLNKYSKMTHDEMMTALFREVNREKKNGLFDIDNIKSFYRNIAPMLAPQDREKMRGIIESIEKY